MGSVFQFQIFFFAHPACSAFCVVLLERSKPLSLIVLLLGDQSDCDLNYVRVWICTSNSETIGYETCIIFKKAVKQKIFSFGTSYCEFVTEKF